jgi:hypothetical protein
MDDEPKKTQIKIEKKPEDDRKLVGDDSLLQMSQDITNGVDDPVHPQIENMKDDFSSERPMKGDRKLNFGEGMGSDMETGMNTDMANMRNSFDNMNSMGPDTGDLNMDSGSDTMSDLDSGMHESATKAIINRMDRTNQERLQKLNSMFPVTSSQMMPKQRKKKNKNVIDIKKMLKNYPPELVNEFMPELQKKVMHKFNEMRKSSREKRRIRKLRRELEKSKKRARRRRKLREQRRRKMMTRRRRRRHHHHHKRKLHHFKPHFSIKKDSRRHQFHSISVVNKFMHRRRNHLNHLHHRERRLTDESPNNSNTSDDPYLDLEKQLENEMKSTQSPTSLAEGKFSLRKSLIFKLQTQLTLRVPLTLPKLLTILLQLCLLLIKLTVMKII